MALCHMESTALVHDAAETVALAPTVAAKCSERAVSTLSVAEHRPCRLLSWAAGEEGRRLAMT